VARRMSHGRRWRRLLAPLAWCYGFGVTIWSRWSLSRGSRARVSVPVVSVGNLTVGGTGKGPIVRWVVEVLRDAGATPVIALRGYRATAAGSDEALEHARLLPGMPIAVGADRAAAIEQAMARDDSIDMVVLDDGFQHWRLARDLDLVLVDATAPGLDEPMLPAGPRRESATALARADAVIVTRADRVQPALRARIEALHGRPPIAWCTHDWRWLEVHDGAASIDGDGSSPSPTPRRVDPSWLAARRVGVVAGLGNPGAFIGQVRGATGSDGAAHWIERGRDHAVYDAASIDRWQSRARGSHCDAIVTTLKDWVKIEPLARAARCGFDIPFVVPIVGVRFIEGEAPLRGMLERLASGRPQRGR